MYHDQHTVSNGKTIIFQFMAEPFDPIFRLPACPAGQAG